MLIDSYNFRIRAIYGLEDDYDEEVYNTLCVYVYNLFAQVFY